MDLQSLLLSSELGSINGMSLQDPDLLASWFTLGDRISLRTEGEVFNATININDRMTDIVVKTNLDINCLYYEYLVGLEVNKLTSIPNFIETYAFFLLENIGPLTTTEEEEGSLQYGQYIPFLLIEKVTGERFGDIIYTIPEEDLPSLMLQLMGALQVAQNRIGFTHYDFHLGNIMYTPLATPQTIIYNLRTTPGITAHDVQGYSIETRHILRIIDYGYSHARLSTIPPGLRVCITDVLWWEGIVPTVKDPLTDILYSTHKWGWDYIGKYHRIRNPTQLERFSGRRSFVVDFMLKLREMSKLNTLQPDGQEDAWDPYLIEGDIPGYTQEQLFELSRGLIAEEALMIPAVIVPLNREEFIQGYIQLITHPTDIEENSYRYAELLSGYKLYTVQQRFTHNLLDIMRWTLAYT